MAVAGIALIVLVAVRLVQSIFSAFRRQRRIRERTEVAGILLHERLGAAKANRIRNEQQQFCWNGYRKFRVADKVEEADSIYSFYLSPHDNKPLPEFLPGQFLTLKFELPDKKRGELKSVIRCYSLSDAPRPDWFRITVKRVAAPRDQQVPAGLISNHLIDNVEQGDILNIQAPRGDFSLDPHEQHPVVLIGGGVGLTPVLSMANSILESGSSRQVWFFYGVRCGREHAMKNHLQKLAETHDNFTLHVCYSNPDSSDRPGEDYDSAGWVDVPTIQNEVGVSNYDFYICGPPPMMATLEPALKKWGVPANRIYSEAFGPASSSAKMKDRPIAKATDAAQPAAKFKIQFSKSGKTSEWDGSAECLLEFAEKAGITIDSGCRAGSCGTCSVAIKSGSVSSTGQCEEGSCLTCVSVPTADLVLDA